MTAPSPQCQPKPAELRRDPLAKIIDADRIGYAEEQRRERAWLKDFLALSEAKPAGETGR